MRDWQITKVATATSQANHGTLTNVFAKKAFRKGLVSTVLVWLFTCCHFTYCHCAHCHLTTRFDKYIRLVTANLPDLVLCL